MQFTEMDVHTQAHGERDLVTGERQFRLGDLFTWCFRTGVL